MSAKLNIFRLIKTATAILTAVFMLSSCLPFQEGIAPPSQTPITDIVVSNEIPPAPDDQASVAAEIVEDGKETRKLNDYTITAEIASMEKQVITGIEKLSYKNRTGNDLDKLLFNLYLNAFNKDSIMMPYFNSSRSRVFPGGVPDYGYIDIKGVIVNNDEARFFVDSTVLTVLLDETMLPDEIFEITVQFEAYVPRINHRTGSNSEAIWCGNFFPVIAVYDEAGWHTEPYYPAGSPFYANMSNYNVKITTPVGCSVIGTGEETFTESDGKRQTTLAAKMVRDFAFVISDKYALETAKTNSDINVNIYTLSESPEIITMMVVALKSLDYYESILANYPYSSIDIIETNLFDNTAIGYPGIIFIDSNFIKNGDIDEAIATEICRQWFGNSIGVNQIKEPWLTEGLVAFMGQRVLYDDEDISSKMLDDYAELSAGLEHLQNKILSQDLSVYTTELSDYKSISVTKAKLMIYSLYQKMGDKMFDKFLKSYYTKHSFRIASSKEFIASAEEVYGKSLTEFFDKWLTESQLPGLSD